MAARRGSLLVQSCKIRALNFSTSCHVNNKWRRQQGLEPEPRRFGPLTNLPDYSFLDGRPVPLGRAKMAKIQLQMEYCKKIAELTHEIDVGMEHYHKRIEKEKEDRKTILENKLKPKGEALLNKNKQ